MDCSHLEKLDGKIKTDKREEPILVCGLMSGVIGWKHAVVGKCEGCKQTLDDPRIASDIDALLLGRIAQNWNWDNDPNLSKAIRDDLKTTLALYKERKGEDAASTALVKAVENGLPKDVALALSTEVLPDASGSA